MISKLCVTAGVLAVILNIGTTAEAGQSCGRTELGSLYIKTVMEGDRQAKAQLVNEATRLIRCLDRQDRLLPSTSGLKGDFVTVLHIAAVIQGQEPLRLTSAEDLERLIRVTLAKGPDHGNRLDATR